MSHPNLSPEINKISDSQLAYHDLEKGDLLIIHGKNAIGKDDELYLIVAGFSDESDPAPIFFVANKFIAYDEKIKWLKLNQGDLAQGGISANLIPELILCMVGGGGIGLGRDYSLEYINGTGQFAYIHAIKKIIQLRYELSESTKSHIKKLVRNYQRKVEKTKEKQKKEEEKRQLKLLRPLVVHTINSIYELQEADFSGNRKICKRGDYRVMNGHLVSLKEGKSMIFLLNNCPRGDQLITSMVEKIEYL